MKLVTRTNFQLFMFFLSVIHVLFSTLTEGFPCFFLSCKANARVYLAKTGHGPHSSSIVLFHVLILLFCVLFCVDCVVHVLFVCKCVLLPPGVNPIAVKQIISHHIISYRIVSYRIVSYRIISYHINESVQENGSSLL